VALGADAARQSANVKASFEAGIREHLSVLTRLISKADSDEKREKAMAILSTMVGSVTLSRAVNDPRLAQSFLDAAAESVREIASS
jgi:TetR/AcrR family transcriptional repressor of nem operon